MKRLIVSIRDNRLCRHCKHRIKVPDSQFDRCRLYKPLFKGDELLVSKYDLKQPIDCPLLTCRYSDIGRFYFRRKITL